VVGAGQVSADHRDRLLRAGGEGTSDPPRPALSSSVAVEYGGRMLIRSDALVDDDLLELAAAGAMSRRRTRIRGRPDVASDRARWTVR
jgi:hypothetical protein